MGNRLVKPPPGIRPIAPPRGRNNQLPRSFPVIRPDSYLPGGAGTGIGGLYPGGGSNQFPQLNQNSFLPQAGALEPPIMNYSNGPMVLPASSQFPPMYAPSMPPQFPLQMQYPNQNAPPFMAPPGPAYDPGFQSYPRRRPARLCRPRRSRRCRPVIHIVDSSSCSTLSSCRSLSPCSRRRRRSRSHSQRCAVTPQSQQPIIVLPIQCQQSQPALSASASNQFQQQPQQIILPPIQLQQSGQYHQQQQLALPPIQLQQPGQYQSQQLSLPPIQQYSSSIMPNVSSSPFIIGNAQPLIQSSGSLPHIANIGQTQQFQPGTIQYVQTMPQSSSPLQYVTAERRSTVAPSRVLVNSTNKKQSGISKPFQRSVSATQMSQMDLKYGRRPFDWYKNKQKDNIIKENAEIQQR